MTGIPVSVSFTANISDYSQPVEKLWYNLLDPLPSFTLPTFAHHPNTHTSHLEGAQKSKSKQPKKVDVIQRKSRKVLVIPKSGCYHILINWIRFVRFTRYFTPTLQNYHEFTPDWKMKKKYVFVAFSPQMHLKNLLHDVKAPKKCEKEYLVAQFCVKLYEIHTFILATFKFVMLKFFTSFARNSILRRSVSLHYQITCTPQKAVFALMTSQIWNSCVKLHMNTFCQSQVSVHNIMSTISNGNRLEFGVLLETQRNANTGGQLQQIVYHTHTEQAKTF